MDFCCSESSAVIEYDHGQQVLHCSACGKIVAEATDDYENDHRQMHAGWDAQRNVIRNYKTGEVLSELEWKYDRKVKW